MVIGITNRYRHRLIEVNGCLLWGLGYSWRGHASKFSCTDLHESLSLKINPPFFFFFCNSPVKERPFHFLSSQVCSLHGAALLINLNFTSNFNWRATVNAIEEDYLFFCIMADIWLKITLFWIFFPFLWNN